MIIECPHCGFSGRVPERAATAPHQARCPKCRSRFDIRDSDVLHPEPAGRLDLRHDLTRPRLDPSDSSYELDPLSGDFAAVARGRDRDEDWDEPWSVDPDDAPGPPRGGAPGPEAEAVQVRRPPPAWALRLFRPSMWRVRLFQAWAILLLVVALLIVVRTAIAASAFEDARFFSNDLLRPVAAVVLLVCASALLCLYVDVSRNLARSTYAPVHSPSPNPAPSSADGASAANPAPGTELARRNASRE